MKTLRRIPWRAAAALALPVVARCTPAPSPAHVPATAAAGVHEITPGDARLWYRVAGRERGIPVVFLHGGPGQGSAHFDALAGPFLEPTLHMVYFDQRGSGLSERPASGDYALATLVEDIERLREALGAPRIVVLGHSFGAILALEYAARYPQRTAGVVVVSGLWDAPMQCRLRLERLAERYPDAVARVRGDTLAADGTRRSDCELEGQALNDEQREAYSLAAMFPDPSVAARMDSVNRARGVQNTGELGRALFGAGLLSYRFRAYSRLTMPVLVIAGREDGAARPAGLRELAERVPDGRFLEYQRSGHFVYLDEPERFSRDLTGFVSALR